MLDCARMQMAGTRQVICADTMTILKHIDTKKVGMASTKEDWPTAFNACRASHKELFSLMPNGGRA